MDLKRKVGPFPLWVWVALVAGGGYLVWKHYAGGTEETEETAYPTAGVPATAEGGTTSGGSGGIAPVEEFLQRGQEAAEGRQIAHEENVEGREIAHLEAQEGREQTLTELPFKMAAAAAKAAGFKAGEKAAHERAAKAAAKAAKGRAKAHHKGGPKGAKGSKRGAERSNGNTGQQGHGNTTNHQPGHTAKTDHRPSSPPGTRIASGGKRRRR